MAKSKTGKIKPAKVRAAIQKVASHNLRSRMNGVDGDEAHRILPEIWPIIQELCLLADACEANMLKVEG